MEHVSEWSIELFLDEDDGQTSATARLHTRDTVMVGVGRARCHPDDVDIPEIGDELAAARALNDLSHKLFEAIAGDIEAVTRHPVTLRS